MRPQRSGVCRSITALLILAGTTVSVRAQEPAPSPRRGGEPAPKSTGSATDARSVARPELLVGIALRSNPLTAPYAISTTWQKGAVVLGGRVGTKQVHDAAVRMAIDLGVPIRDNLVIDTALAHLAAQGPGLAAGANPAVLQGTLTATSPYVYPPPLMGRVDDPFFGFVPPLVSFPPWWNRRAQAEVMVRPRPVEENAGRREPGASSAPRVNAAGGGWQPLEVDPVKGQVEVSVDVLGQVFLRGSVASEQVAREIIEAARSVPGVSRVESELSVVPRRAEGEEAPPPPPEPMINPAAPNGANPRPAPARPAPAPELAPTPKRARPAATGPAALDSQKLTERVVNAIQRRPQAAELPVKVRSTGGTVTLSGTVPTTYEAMLVYRAAQQTPGVNDIIDRLDFTVPDENNANPLVQKGRPEDVEPYLTAQIRRHIGELAHLDRIQAHGDSLVLHGTLENAQDRDRLIAILRSIPVLHGFQIHPEFTGE
jgi:osmotically-inducible protein OsmY